VFFFVLLQSCASEGWTTASPMWKFYDYSNHVEFLLMLEFLHENSAKQSYN